MSGRTSPPFRADHVGSLLRPPRLLEARENFTAGLITAAELRAVEDEEIPGAIRMQEEVGLQSATDGEFRRASWHMDFIYALGGVSKAPGHLAVKFHNAAGDIEFTPASIMVDGKLRIDETIFADAFTFVRDHVTTAVPKLTIPSPNMVHYRGGPAMLDPAVYPDIEEFWADLAAAYADEVAAARRPGLHLPAVRRHQPGLPQRPRPARRDHRPRRGRRAPAPSLHQARSTPRSRTGPRAWPSPPTCAAATSAPPGWPPAGTTSWPRPCSPSSTWTGSSWSTTTSAPAASSPCASSRKGKQVVLGLVTTKRPELESRDDLKRRVDEAAKYVPLDQLCLSGQCGFSSTSEGNALTQAEQLAKLRLIVETARDIWGD